MKVIIEVRAGEGGQDSRLFIQDMRRMYEKYFDACGWTHDCL